jgi:hypothetical protein
VDDQQPETKAIEDRRWDEMKFVQDTLFRVWTAYLFWFIWFNSSIFGAFSFLTKPSDQPTKYHLLATAVICIGFELAAIAVTIAVHRYSLEALRRVDSVIAEGGFHPGVSSHILLPARIISVAPPACIAVFLLGIAAWVYVLLGGT